MVPSANTALARYSSASPDSGEIRFARSSTRCDRWTTGAAQLGIVAEFVGMASLEKPRTRGVRSNAPFRDPRRNVSEVEFLQVERQLGLEACGQCVRPSEPV